MDDKLRNEIALFKFSLIAPVINGSLNEPLKEYLEKVCVKTYEVPGKGPRELSPKTIRQWLYEYQRYGIDGLKRNPAMIKEHHGHLLLMSQGRSRNFDSCIPERQ